jgi:hypothetical protein
MRSHVIRWLAIPALVAGMALSLAAPAWAQAAPPAQPPTQVSSVGVTPVTTSPNDPNKGQWFFIDGLAPGQVGHSSARITNPATVPVVVHLYLADLNFAPNGGAQLADEGKSTDIGSWGGFGDNSTITLAPKESRVVPFTVTVPNDAEPGDHVGSVVAQTDPQSTADNSLLKIVRRVATRLYVTLPGEAHAAFSIKQVTMEKDSNFYTKEITTTVVLHNDGRVRLRPTVLIDGKQAKGSSALLSNSVEPYVVTQKVPIWGGPVTAHVEVHSKVGQVDGPVRTQNASTFVIPYVLFIGLALLVGFFFLVRWLWSKRGGKYAAMQADLRRFERLLQQQRAAGEDTANVAGEAELAIKAAIKQAGRAGDKDTEIKLRGKLAELREQEAAPPPPPSAPSPAPTSPAPAAAGSSPQPTFVAAPAPEPVNGNGNGAVSGNGNGNGNGHHHQREDEASLVAILRVLATAPPGGDRFALIKAARNYGKDAIEAHPEELTALPDDVRIRLLRGPSSQPEPASTAPSEIA